MRAVLQLYASPAAYIFTAGLVRETQTVEHCAFAQSLVAPDAENLYDTSRRPLILSMLSATSRHAPLICKSSCHIGKHTSLLHGITAFVYSFVTLSTLQINPLAQRIWKACTA